MRSPDRSLSRSAWGIKGPAGYGFFAGIANHGTAEFLISAHRL
jgi:hypothetical protein